MLFLVGPHGAGKTKLSEIAVEYGCIAIDLGPALRNLHLASGASCSFSEWIQDGELRNGKNFTDILLAAEVEKAKLHIEKESGHPDILIVGSRSIDGVEYLSTIFPKVNGRSRRIVYIDAPFSLKLKRYNVREGLSLAPEEFELLLAADTRMGLEKIRESADVLLWNDIDEDSLRKRVKELLFS